MDFLRLENYTENNRVEAKKAQGGFPQSVWETYSAFANTLGGVILLGVVERADYSLRAVGLPDPEGHAELFWETVNDPAKVSVNVLSREHITVEEVEGKRIVVVTVPKAARTEQPVYVGGNPFGGTYRRSGEGDYKCTHAEVEGMLRDASAQTQDMRVLPSVSLAELNGETLKRYRAQLQKVRRGYAWGSLSDGEFLRKIGGASVYRDELKPTAAGLLAFGSISAIQREYPRFQLRYEGETPLGGEAENLYDFYLRTEEALNGAYARFPDEIKKGLREGLVNCLVNADYYGGGGITVTQTETEVTFSNPGGFRIDLEKAKAGGVSDPRNEGLTKLFQTVNVGTGLGRGIPHLYAAWRAQGWRAPVISEAFNPDRITVRLPLTNREEENESRLARSEKRALQKAIIIQQLTDRGSATCRELASALGVSPKQTWSVITELAEENVLTAQGSRRYRTYRLKR